MVNSYGVRVRGRVVDMERIECSNTEAVGQFLSPTHY